MPKDYREIGRQLAKQWLSRQGQFETQLFEEAHSPRLGPEWNFIRALYQHERGDSSYLIYYLRSERPLTVADRENWAQVLEGVLRRGKKIGRPQDKLQRNAASAARAFYKCWLDECEAQGIKTFGYRGLMKDDAVRFIIKKFQPETPRLDFEIVRELVDRPKSRRNS